MSHAQHNLREKTFSVRSQHECKLRASWERHLESRLSAHPDLAAALVLATGLLLRVRSASGTFLNPDEALHVLAAHRASFALAYDASLRTAHPPLLILVLYFWRALGNSEFVQIGRAHV